VFVALVIQHVKRMRRIILFLWPIRLYQISPQCLTNDTLFFGGKKLLNTKGVFWISPQLLSETFLILRIQGDIIINVRICYSLAGIWVRIPSRTWMSVCCCLSVVCCQVEVSATGWSLVQRSPTECEVSECDREASIMRGTLAPWGLLCHGDNYVIHVNEVSSILWHCIIHIYCFIISLKMAFMCRNMSL